MNKNTPEARLAILERSYQNLAERVETLEGGRPGRKPLPILVSIEGVCGIDPARDSETCPDATLYRRQKGCKGTACLEKASEYYSEYRANRKAEAEAEAKSRKRRHPARA